MKLALLIVEGAKQIMLTPESDHEKTVLKMLNPDNKLKVVSKWGTFTGEKEIVGVSVDKCQGGYYRAYENTGSLIFLIEEDVKEAQP